MKHVYTINYSVMGSPPERYRFISSLDFEMAMKSALIKVRHMFPSQKVTLNYFSATEGDEVPDEEAKHE